MKALPSSPVTTLNPPKRSPSSHWLNSRELLIVRRLLRRALLLCGAYVALLAAVGVAGFLGDAIDVWPRFWGVGVLAGIVIYGRRYINRATEPPARYVLDRRELLVVLKTDIVRWLGDLQVRGGLTLVHLGGDNRAHVYSLGDQGRGV